MPSHRQPLLGIATALEEVRSVYKELDGRPLERQCELRTGCCHFQLTGETPYLTRGEALVAAKAWRAAGRKEMRVRKDGACPFLSERNARCMIYESRPLGCRTHFCEAAGGNYPRSHVLDLIRRLEAIDRDIGGAGPVRLEPAVRSALQSLR